MRASILCLLSLFSLYVPPLTAASAQNAPAKQHAIAMHGDIKYPATYTHFAGTTPNAPKGGTLRIGVVGKFDCTNPFITKGTAPVGLSRFSERLVFQSLMVRSPDEPFTLYACIAESIEVAPDRSWITFHVNPLAKWADGTAITADDVIFSHATLRDKGAPNMRLMYSKVKTVEKLGPLSVKFTFNTQENGTYNPELPLLMGLMSVLPKAYFDGKDFEKTTLDFVMGSGPYKIASIKPGHQIVYERRPDYWAKDLPFSVGKYNFDRIQADYYLEPNVARMAFESGAFDYLAEAKPEKQKHLMMLAKNPKSDLRIINFDHKRSSALNAYVMNGRRDLFKDRRVREALSYAFDFHWINKNLFQGNFKRNRSFFENTDLSPQGLPTPAEFKLLEPFKTEIPAEVFTTPYFPANYAPTDNFRDGLKKAKDLLKEAGWEIQNGILINKTSGQKFQFELMLYNKEDEKVALAFARILKTLGIIMSIRTLDPAQYELRRIAYDYDMILNSWDAGMSPGAELYFYWGSDMADQEGSRNYPYIKNKAIDYLCKYIADAKTRDDLKTGCHALDRVLMWGHYVIPLYYGSTVFIIHRSSIEHPPVDPALPISLENWWAAPANIAAGHAVYAKKVPADTVHANKAPANKVRL